MPTWTVLLGIAVFYLVVAIGFGVAYGWKLGLVWPITLLWMIFGNIQ